MLLDILTLISGAAIAVWIVYQVEIGIDEEAQDD